MLSLLMANTHVQGINGANWMFSASCTNDQFAENRSGKPLRPNDGFGPASG
jgi:hypothetical protein